MMINTGVFCNVTECEYNRQHDKCGLGCIEVVHDESSVDSSVGTPHYCRSYERKTANVR